MRGPRAGAHENWQLLTGREGIWANLVITAKKKKNQWAAGLVIRCKIEMSGEMGSSSVLTGIGIRRRMMRMDESGTQEAGEGATAVVWSCQWH